MNRIKRLDPEDRENLVAYLDGELDEDSIAAIDSALSDSPVARHEVEMLTRTWELLDLLPEEKASDSFSRTTLQNAFAGIDKPPAPPIDWTPRIRRLVGAVAWGGGLLLAGWLGFRTSRDWVENPADALLRDLPVIRNLDTYRDIEDLEFLQKLQREGLLDDLK